MSCLERSTVHVYSTFKCFVWYLIVTFSPDSAYFVALILDCPKFNAMQTGCCFRMVCASQ